MTNIRQQALEDALRVLTKRTHHCLLTLTGLLNKFPGFSEKSVSSENEKIEKQRIYIALQVAAMQLAKRISGEITMGKLVPRVQQEKESASAGCVLFDSHSTFA